MYPSYIRLCIDGESGARLARSPNLHGFSSKVIVKTTPLEHNPCASKRNMQHRTDSRFAALKSDPRFSRHSQKKEKVIPDERFAAMHKSKDFEKKMRTKTDCYGRPNEDVALSSESSDDSSSESRGRSLAWPR